MTNRVRERRLAKQMTQKQLAQSVGVTTRSIISLETGQYNPSLLLAYRLAQALELPMEELFCLAENLQLETGLPASQEPKPQLRVNSEVAYYLL